MLIWLIAARTSRWKATLWTTILRSTLQLCFFSSSISIEKQKRKDKQTKVKMSLGRLFLRQLCGYVRMLLTWPCSRLCSTLIKILQSCKSAGTCLISSFVSTFSPPGTIHTEDNQHHVSPGDNKTNLCGTGRKTRADEASQLPLWPFYFF